MKRLLVGIWTGTTGKFSFIEQVLNRGWYKVTYAGSGMYGPITSHTIYIAIKGQRN